MAPGPDDQTQQWIDQARLGIEKPLTAGNLLDYQLCPRKFLLASFAPAHQLRALGAVRALHAAIRATLVACDRAGGPAAVSLQWLRDEFRRRFDGRACADSLEEERTIKLGLAILARWQAYQPQADEELVGADVLLAGSIEDLDFVATADRVVRLGDGRLAVARYDVRARPPSARKLAQDFSIGLLVTLAEDHYGERPIARLYALRADRIIDAELGDDQIAAVRQRALTTARAIRADTTFEARPGQQCSWCRVRAQCPEWEERRRSLLDFGGR